MALTRSEMMARVKREDTAPEMRVRRIFWSEGLRYRLHQQNLPGKPDIVLSGRKAVVEVRGCFWHQHGCKRSVPPRTRVEYWTQKFTRNIARDERNLAALRQLGWKVFVVWECETTDSAKVLRLADKIKSLPLRPTKVGGRHR